jgi:adenylate kinase family enzyme
LCGDEELRRRVRVRSTVSGRSDDTDPVMDKRIDVYHSDTMTVVEWWKGQLKECVSSGDDEAERVWLRELDGERSIEAVYEDVRRGYLEWCQRLKLLS